MPQSSQKTALDQRALAALAKARNFTTDAVRLLLETKELLSLGIATLLAEWRESEHRFAREFAEEVQRDLKLREQAEELAILRGRFERIPATHRNRYTPEERFRIVEFVRTYNLSRAEAAGRFLIDAATIGRWIQEVVREPDAKTVGSLVKAVPPVRRVDDVTARLVTMLDDLKIAGSKRIAQMLTRADRPISAESVRRIRKKPRPSRPAPSPARTSDVSVKATSPNHVWMTDITTVPALFKAWAFKIVVILDVYSRFPLSAGVFWKEPSADEITSVLRRAIDCFGKPKHFVTDQGAQFKSKTFGDELSTHGILHRFGAIGRSGSIAIIERFWRSVKEMLHLRFWSPLSRRHLEEKLDVVLDYYAKLRPHQALAGATPAELYFGVRTMPNLSSASTPEGDMPLEIAFADAERRLPYLIPRHIAA